MRAGIKEGVNGWFCFNALICPLTTYPEKALIKNRGKSVEFNLNRTLSLLFLFLQTL